MWQSFTEDARIVVFKSMEEAQKSKSALVEPEHLLLAMLRFDHYARPMMGEAGVSAENVERFMAGQTFVNGNLADMTLSTRAKEVIDLAYRELRQLGDKVIGTEHLFLGLVAEGDATSQGAMHQIGIGLEAAKAEVIKRRKDPSEQQ